MDIGIDLGTTFSVLAVAGKVGLSPEYPPGNYLEECDVTIIPTPEGEQTFPSVMVEDPENPGAFLFGSEAVRRVEDGITPVMFSKRKMGTGELYKLTTCTVTAADAAREFLRYLKKCAETALGQPVHRAVVTHPAYFELAAIVSTRQAATDAGFDMSLSEQMLMEPVAAALAYVRTDQRDPLKILTYDLGGGTFDVTCLERTGGVIVMKAFGGDHLLGGYNFDRELLNWFFRRLQQQGRRFTIDDSDPADRGRLAQLLRIAENVKIKLASVPGDTTPVDFRIRKELVDENHKPIQANEHITRQEFLVLIEPYLKRTLECCIEVLRKAGYTPDEVDEVLLVGGSSYGPWISDRLNATFQRVKPKLFSPDLCVGIGAALHTRHALPGFVPGESISLVLDLPDRTGLSRLNVMGQFRMAGKAFDGAGCQVTLSGSSIVPATLLLDAEGRFIFPDVEIAEDQTSTFHISLRDAHGAELLSHTFSVMQTMEAGYTSTVTTVMPRPLYVETVDGLVRIAGEGQSLPAKIQQNFLRTNDNANIALRLIQEDEAVGEIRIENIPVNSGKGSKVNLEVVVSADNWVRGTARIQNAQGKQLYEAPVKIQFRIAPIPSIDGISDDLAKCRQLLASDELKPPLTDLIRGKAESLVAEADRLLQQIPVERQEVQAKLLALHRILTPPQDVFRPPREEMLDTIRDCRLMITKQQASSVDGDTAASTTVVNSTLRKEAAVRAGRLQRLIESLDRLEVRALAAMEERDLRSWAQVFEDLRHLKASLDKSTGAALPTFLTKLVAQRQIMEFMDRLAYRLEELDIAGRLQNWQNAIVDLRDAFQLMLKRIHAVSDELPEHQGLATIQQILHDGQLPALEKRLNTLGGADVAKA